MDKLVFFLLPLLIFTLTPFAFAEIEYGVNYDKETLSINPDGSKEIRYSTIPFDRVLNNGIYKDYVYSDLGNVLELKTSNNKIQLDKTSCGFSFYNKNGVALFQDSIIAFNSIVDLYEWNAVSQINSATCESYYDQGNNALVAKKYATNIGYMEYKYIFDKGAWKTQLEATNLTGLIDRVFGFDQTINLNTDIISFGGVNRNLDNFNGQTLNRTFLENNKADILNFLNGIVFDFDFGFEYLDSITVIDTGANSSKLVFHYMRNNEILMPNETLIIDPTFSDTNVTFYRAIMAAQTGTACSTTGSVLDSGTRTAFLDDSDLSGSCAVSAYTFDISTINDSYTVTDVAINGTLSQAANMSGVTCVFTQIDNPLNGTGWTNTAANAKTQFDAIVAETTEYNNNTDCQSTGNYLFNFDADGLSDINANLHGGFDYFDIGYRFDTQTRIPAGVIQSTFSSLSLEITYVTIPAPDAITDLTLDSATQTTATISFTAPNLNGESLQNYSLYLETPQTNNVLTFNQNFTDNPLTITGLTLGTSYSANATANTAGGKNFTGMVILNFTTASFDPPGAPTLGALALSDTAIRFTSVAGTAGDNSTIWYGLRCDLNGAGFSFVVTNSSLPASRLYEYTGLTLGDELICQWRDGSVDGWSPWSNSATDVLTLQVLTAQRTTETHPDDKLLEFINFITASGGVYFGLGVVPFVTMLFGFMAGKKTVRIFTLITLMLMGMIHASGYYVYPDWYWTLAILFGIGLVMGRMKSD